MRIAFYPQSLLPFHATSIEERPLGGTETGVIRLAEALQNLGHQVVVFTSETDPPKSHPPYFHLSKANGLQAVDVFICIREWIPLVYPIPTRKKFFWTGDAPDQVHNFGLGDKRVGKLIDGVLTVSNWHAQALSEASGLSLDKCFAIKNGIHLPYFTSPDPQPERKKRLVYASTPFRGLEHLARLFPLIQAQVPECELHVFSGFDVYRGKTEYSPEIQRRYEGLFEHLKGMPGVKVRGNVLQRELAYELLQARVLAYPNTFPETSCITVMEAQAAGCIPVTSALAALPETVGECGCVIGGTPGEAAYDNAFVTQCVNLLQNDSTFNELSLKAKNRAARELSWGAVAERFVRYLAEVHGLSSST
ncbi:MAG: glycosyltransferase family 4 protein [Bdellovibrionales bacterium]|nr:glycosyltransferase family 4 protein [Bdellovibrionales bacterium]